MGSCNNKKYVSDRYFILSCNQWLSDIHAKEDSVALQKKAKILQVIMA